MPKFTHLTCVTLHRHARACRGHPRLALRQRKAWMAGTSPAMTNIGSAPARLASLAMTAGMLLSNARGRHCEARVARRSNLRHAGGTRGPRRAHLRSPSFWRNEPEVYGSSFWRNEPEIYGSSFWRNEPEVYGSPFWRNEPETPRPPSAALRRAGFLPRLARPVVRPRTGSRLRPPNRPGTSALVPAPAASGFSGRLSGRAHRSVAKRSLVSLPPSPGT